MRKWLRWGAILGLVVLSGGVAVACWALAASRAALDGDLTVSGLSAPASVHRDRLGVVTIDASNERDAMLDEYAAISRKVATDTGSQMVDLRKAFIDHLKANNAEGKPKGVLTGDGVHLNPAGNKLVAVEMGKAIGIKVE